VSAPVTSRRVSAGITAEPGATSLAPAWWGATDWIEVEVRGAVREHRDVCKDHHVDPDTVVAVARGMAHYADHKTGRDCRPTNARLVELLRVSLSTVQRARRVLKQLGLLVELIRGRSIMTRAERLSAWRRGSSHRAIAATFALTSRGRSRPARGPEMGPSQLDVDAQVVSARPTAVERDTPPGAHKVSVYVQLGRTHLRATTEQRGRRSAPAHTETSDGRKAGRLDPAARRLAEGARFRLAWLRGTSARRLAPTLHRFARAGWTAQDVERAVVEALTARGWRLPRELAQPAAYLATLLREVDPADRPGALDEQRAAAERAQRAYERRLIHGTPCPHGQPAGAEPSPLRGHLACPACRAAAVVEWPTVRAPGSGPVA
jgi:hypothetical protein